MQCSVRSGVGARGAHHGPGTLGALNGRTVQELYEELSHHTAGLEDSTGGVSQGMEAPGKPSKDAGVTGKALWKGQRGGWVLTGA